MNIVVIDSDNNVVSLNYDNVVYTTVDLYRINPRKIQISLIHFTQTSKFRSYKPTVHEFEENSKDIDLTNEQLIEKLTKILSSEINFYRNITESTSADINLESFCSYGLKYFKG